MTDGSNAVQPQSSTLTPREQCDGDWSWWCELMEVMLYGGKTCTKAKVAACLAAVSAGDGTELRLQAHALKGAAAALCLPRLRQRCAELERSAQVPSEAPGWRQQVLEVEALFQRLDLTYKWVRSLGDAARDDAFEAVNGQWEALQVYIAHSDREPPTVRQIERRSCRDGGRQIVQELRG